jgi:hypothetical protein
MEAFSAKAYHNKVYCNKFYAKQEIDRLAVSKL